MPRSFRLLVCGVLLGACAHARAQEAPAPVSVAVVAEHSPAAEITLPATLTSRRVSALSVEAEGLVAELLVDVGDAVAAGAPLLRLRPTRKTLERDAARAAVQHAEAAARLAEVKERRQAELVAQRMTPQDSYDVAVAELAQARATHAAARAALARVQDEVARLELRAPFAGVIQHKHTELGAWVQPGDLALTLVETAVLRAEFALPQVHYADLAAGSPVRLRLDPLPGTEWPIAVTRVIPVVQEAGRTLRVQAEFVNDDRRRAPGMSGSVTLTLGDAAAARVLAVPVDAVITQTDGTHLVWRVSGAGDSLTATPQPLRIGRRLGDAWEVLEAPGGALPAGTRVVIRGNERLRPGQPVRLTDSP